MKIVKGKYRYGQAGGDVESHHLDGTVDLPWGLVTNIAKVNWFNKPNKGIDTFGDYFFQDMKKCRVVEGDDLRKRKKSSKKGNNGKNSDGTSQSSKQTRICGLSRCQFYTSLTVLLTIFVIVVGWLGYYGFASRAAVGGRKGGAVEDDLTESESEETSEESDSVSDDSLTAKRDKEQRQISGGMEQ